MAAVSKHGTLSAGAVATVTLTGFGSAIEIFNRSATSTDLIYITSGRTAAATTDPVAAADETFVIPAGKSIQIPYPATSPGDGCVVKLISATTPTYSVQLYAFRQP